eukprot:TRINITY_DN5962_c0_g1_i6.p9 TRINITY_DN5962_c0_g1~~TRINITY_DN5962_c0_g1_i6.p9  ORF type:complete len:113 (+),score=7.55 TRINITY_DN5962_c0_g1_i6:514-852(+)
MKQIFWWVMSNLQQYNHYHIIQNILLLLQQDSYLSHGFLFYIIDSFVVQQQQQQLTVRYKQELSLILFFYSKINNQGTRLNYKEFVDFPLKLNSKKITYTSNLVRIHIEGIL